MVRYISRLLFVSWLTLAVGCGSGQDKEQFNMASDAFLDAMQAIDKGDSAQAISSLTASLDLMPTAVAYIERAKLYVTADKLSEALRDSRAAVELEPDSTDAQWFLDEIEKPAKKRFKGKFKNPPSSGK